MTHPWQFLNCVVTHGGERSGETKLCDRYLTVWSPLNCVIITELCDHHWTVWSPLNCVIITEMYDHHLTVWSPPKLWSPLNCVIITELCDYHWTMWSPLNCVVITRLCGHTWMWKKRGDVCKDAAVCQSVCWQTEGRMHTFTDVNKTHTDLPASFHWEPRKLQTEAPAIHPPEFDTGGAWWFNVSMNVKGGAWWVSVSMNAKGGV